MTKMPKCKYCERPGEYRGWAFELRKVWQRKKLDRKNGGGVERQMKAMFKKVYLWMCEAHLLKHQFQLMPYECTAKCVKQRIDANKYVMKPAEMVVWFPLGPILGGQKPRCGWCGKNLKHRLPSCEMSR